GGIKEGAVMTQQNISQWRSIALAAIVSGAAGWLLGHAGWLSSTPVTVGAAARSDVPAPHTLLDPGPVIVVAGDGRVTLHVDHESLPWVLAEIDRQSGAHVTAPGAPAVPASAAPAAHEGATVAVAAVNSDELVARALRGAEPQRYESLVQGQNGGALPEDVLKTLYQTDASPRVRLLAFDYALEGTEADPALRRSVLAAASLLPDPVVSQEAGRLLETLDRAGSAQAQQVSEPH
ncbi:MAG: hypothetical protein ABJD97_18315, partial [Betaproteobacteria bacterium]